MVFNFGVIFVINGHSDVGDFMMARVSRCWWNKGSSPRVFKNEKNLEH